MLISPPHWRCSAKPLIRSCFCPKHSYVLCSSHLPQSAPGSSAGGSGQPEVFQQPLGVPLLPPGKTSPSTCRRCRRLDGSHCTSLHISVLSAACGMTQSYTSHNLFCITHTHYIFIHLSPLSTNSSPIRNS